MTGYALFALAGLALLALWAYNAINTERLQIAADNALRQFEDWADDTIATFDDEDDAAWTARVRAVAAAQAAEVQR